MKKKLLIPLLLLATFGGCKCDQFFLAEEATYEALQAEYREYVEADESLSETSRRIRLETLERWRENLEAYRQGMKK